MSILLLIVDVVIINYLFNQLLHPWEGVHLLGLRKSFNLAYISFKLRFINLLDILFLFIQVVNI